MVVLGGRQVQLGEDVADVLFHGAVAHDQLTGDGAVGAALGHEPEHLALAWRQAVQRVPSTRPGEQLGHDLGVEHRAPGTDPPDAVEELGDVGDADDVTVNAHISDGLRPTGHDVRREGDRLVIHASCPAFLADWCSVRYTVEVPSDLAVVVHASDGRVTVTDVGADVEASSDNGRVELARIEGNIEVRSDNGSVTATAIRQASRAQASSDNGDVRLEFLDPPDDVVARSDNGSVDVVIPDVGAIAYNVEADSDNGTVSFPIRTDPDGERTIRATSDNGDVTITYALD